MWKLKCSVSYKDFLRTQQTCICTTIVTMNSARYDPMMLGEKSANYFHTFHSHEVLTMPSLFLPLLSA